YEATLPAGEAPAGGAGTGDAAAGGAAANLDVLAETGAEGSSSLAGLGVAGLLASAGVALVLIRRGRFALGGCWALARTLRGRAGGTRPRRSPSALRGRPARAGREASSRRCSPSRSRAGRWCSPRG